jgi:hypothetical protein
MGHGHVTPNPDGSKARCGGPVMCSKCAQELAQLQRIKATGQKMAEVIEEAHQTEAQPISPEVWEAQQQELQRLARLVAELTQYNTEKDERVRELVAVEKELQARVRELEENERKTLELLKDGHSAHVLILRGDIAVSRRQLAHLLGDAYQELFVKLEESGTQPEAPQNPPSLPQEPPVPVLAGDLSSGQEYGGYFVVGSPEYNTGYADGYAGLPSDSDKAGSTKGAAIYGIGWRAGVDARIGEGRKP